MVGKKKPLTFNSNPSSTPNRLIKGNVTVLSTSTDGSCSLFVTPVNVRANGFFANGAMHMIASRK